MGNLDAATSAVAEELAKVKEGAAFYAQRVAALEEMIRSLNALGGTSVGSGTTKKRGRKPGSSPKQPTKAKRGRPAKASTAAGAAKSSGKKDLPSTKGTFWQDQVTSTPQSWTEILDGAVANLGITPTSEQRKKLQQRMIFAVNALVKEGKIKDSGSGRERQFFK